MTRPQLRILISVLGGDFGVGQNRMIDMLRGNGLALANNLASAKKRTGKSQSQELMRRVTESRRAPFGGLLPRQQRSLGCGQTSDGHAVGRAADVVEAAGLEERDGFGIAAVFAADSDF